MRTGFLKNITAGVCMLVLSLDVHSQDAQRRMSDLGTQVVSQVIQGGAFVRDRSGREYVYTVAVGHPAQLLGYDLASGKLQVQLPLADIDNAWDIISATDGIVYIAGRNGNLFRHVPGSKEVKDLGRALSGETVIFSLTAGLNGEVFGGTYPGCRVFSYRQGQGFRDVGKGRIVPNESYVRSVAFSPQTGKLYAGIGSHAGLVEVDPASGARKPMMDKKYSQYEFIYSQGVATGVKGGDRLFAWATSHANRKTLVYNLSTGKQEQELPSMDTRSVIKSVTDNNVFYTSGNVLYKADFSQPQLQPKKVSTTTSATLDSYWGKNGKLYLITTNRSLVAYDPSSGTRTLNQLQVPEQSVNIHTIVEGPDGRIWTGGYLAGGNSAYDPQTKKVQVYNGLDQTEGMVVQGKNIYFGNYPRSRIYKYNTDQPWNLKNNNPKLIAEVNGQDRPYATASVEKLNRVYFGTVPNYGKLGGALVECNVQTDEVKVFPEVVQDQSILSLTWQKDLLIGGTSIAGGIGSKPVAKEAKLFGWDAVARKKTFEITPVPGALSVSGLVSDQQGKVWGLADNIVFVFDPATQKVTARKEVFPANNIRNYLRGGFIAIQPSGLIYVAINDTLYQVDPKTLQVTKVSEKVTFLTKDRNGNLYFKRASQLWKMSN